MPDVLTYRFGHDITNRQQLIDIDQAYWKLIVNGSIDFRYTIKNSEEFDRMIERSPHGFAAVYVNEKPALLLKAMMYVTGGLNMNIPQASDKLTGNGTWETFNPEGDTVTFVTCTASPAFFGYRIGDVRLTDDVIRKACKEYSDKRFKTTYSPVNIHATITHTRNGALPVTLLPKARPGLVVDDIPSEDVLIWGYDWPTFDESLFDYLNDLFRKDLKKDLRAYSPHCFV